MSRQRVCGIEDVLTTRQLQRIEKGQSLPTIATAVYIADKYDLDDEKEEKKLRNKLVELNLINNFVYLDSNSIDDNFKDEFNNKYHYQLTDDYPTIIVISNRRVINSYKSLNVEKINFEELK